MYLVMGITGKVGGATARHLLKQGKKVRALVRSGEKTTEWADQGVELVDGDWNHATTIAAVLKGVEGAFVMLPTVPALSRAPPTMTPAASRRDANPSQNSIRKTTTVVKKKPQRARA
jgi:uncharacterized protein YbjT (DUF2867 family)